KQTVEQTIDFVQRELTDKDHGFYSALDADSEGAEGKYYVWSFDEIKNILDEDAELFCEFYNVTPNGNWEHTNILRILIPLGEFAHKKNIDEAELDNTLKKCREKLFRERNKRIRPQLD